MSASPNSAWIAAKKSLYDSVFDAADRASDLELLRDDAHAARIASADWSTITSWMVPKQFLHAPDGTVLSAIDRLRSSRLLDRVLDWYIDVVRTHFAVNALPVVNRKPHDGSLSNEESVVIELQRTLSTLCDALRHYTYPLAFVLPSADAQDERARVRFRLSLHAMCDIALSDSKFQLCARMFIEHQLQGTIANFNHDDLRRRRFIEQVRVIRQMINLLEIQGFMEKIVAEVYYSFIQLYVLTNYAKQWAEDEPESVVRKLTDLVQGPITEYLSMLVRPEQDLRVRLLDLATECLVRLRIEEMFDIVIYFPDSMPSLEDLKACMKTQEHRTLLVSSFQNSCRNRLLHCGANTYDIISFYMSTIQVFKVLEPRGVLLDKVSRPIRRYLRDRDDTVKCIVHGMLAVEDADTGDLSELGKELADTSGGVANINGEGNSGDDNDYLDMNWTPDPIDAAPDFRTNRRNLDLISSLLSLHDNKEVFVKEIVVVLANRLLHAPDYGIDRELVQLELLKLRFGESELQNCDIMVKDISESKRVDSNIFNSLRSDRSASNGDGDQVVHASMLSRLYWPALKNEDLKLPDIIEKQLKHYSTRFSALKLARKLTWMKHLGTVDIKLELQDRTLEFTVSPDRASLIYLFQDKPMYSLNELCKSLNLDEAVIHRAISFWIKNGVIKEDSDQTNTYVLLETAEEAPVKKMILDDAAGSSVQTSDEKAAEEMRIYWSYIVGMLTNLQQLPLDRIQSFLKMLIPKDMGYYRSIDELCEFLNLMVAEEKLEFSTGMYRLKK
ncbi:hypothetical protein V1514DRAFT_323455 [Lipomyces japonicus]|uniref:uncharacterized protein n=1 Tax=Lipomyces japonicus TaxID=56871 RepID=UPI0034CDD37A